MASTPPNHEPPSPKAAAPAGALKERPAPAKPGHLPPWRVLLHNDDEIDMDAVMLALIELAALPEQRAYAVMMEAHHTGVSLVLVTHKERAELYRDQFACKSLTVTIEPAN